jgi:hypothetical protein
MPRRRGRKRNGEKLKGRKEGKINYGRNEQKGGNKLLNKEGKVREEKG